MGYKYWFNIGHFVDFASSIIQKNSSTWLIFVNWMKISTMSQSNKSDNPWKAIVGVAVIVVFLVGLFMLARFVFTLMYYLSPLMLIAALIIDHRVVTDYFKWIRNIFRRDNIAGVIVGILSVIGFPVLSAYFLARALLKKQVKKVKSEYERRRDGDLVEYEELETDFPPRQTRREEKSINDDDLVR